MEQYIVGIDSGTTSIKAVLFDLKGNEIDKQAYVLRGIFPEENQYEEDMGEIWEKAQLGLKAIASRHPKESIIGIGITAQGDGLWLIDGQGEPVRNGICFCDGRAADEVDQWVQDGTCDALFKLAGTRIFTGNQNGIVRWMERHEQESLHRAKYFLHLKDYLFYKLTGEMSTDATDQSLILIDPVTGQYNEEIFRLCGMEQYREKYPPIRTAKENAFVIRKSVAEELGLNAKLIVTSGPMDVAACALGSGVVESGHCCSIIGTAALHEMVIPKPLQDDVKAGMTVSHAVEGRWLRLMASLAGGPNIEWMMQTIGGQVKLDARAAGVNVYTYMEKLIAEVPIGANGVMYHPYLLAGGERAPFTDPHARASYTGISVKHTLADMVRATYEGVAFAMMDCYRHMPLAIEQVTVCGGGAKSAAWCQMFADALGSRIVTVKGEELGAKGVIMNNAVVQKIYPSYREAAAQTVKMDRVYLPDTKRHEEYLVFYELYRRTWELLRETWKMRAKILHLT